MSLCFGYDRGCALGRKKPEEAPSKAQRPHHDLFAGAEGLPGRGALDGHGHRARGRRASTSTHGAGRRLGGRERHGVVATALLWLLDKRLLGYEAVVSDESLVAMVALLLLMLRLGLE